MLNKKTGGQNWIGLVLTVAALVELVTRPKTLYKKKPVTRGSVGNGTTVSWFSSAVALGSLLFSLHCFATDSSTVIAWTWSGYPIRGPVPHVHGAFTLVAQVVGLSIPVVGFTGLLQSPVWYFFGAASAYTLYSFNDWTGYYGGLGLVAFLTSIIPQVMRNASSTARLGQFYFWAFFTTIVLYLANVWTVAYAFVPGGQILRERSDL
jgi:hypothetical protein